MRLVRTLHERTHLGDLVEVLDRFSTEQLWLRAAILLSGFAALATLLAAGESLAVPLIAITAALAVIATTHPDSVMGLVFVLIVAVEWAATVDDHRSPWSLLAALCLLVFHTASACTATAPQTAHLHADVWRRWGIRLAIVSAITAAAWLLTFVLAASERDGHDVLAGAGLLAVAGFGWWLLTSRSAARPSREIGSGGADRGDDGVEQIDEVAG